MEQKKSELREHLRRIGKEKIAVMPRENIRGLKSADGIVHLRPLPSMKAAVKMN